MEFFAARFEKNGEPAGRSMVKDKRVDQRGDNVVKRVRPGRDAEPSNGEQRGKVDPGDRPKTELRPVERSVAAELSVQNDDVMVGAEQGR